MNTYPGARTLEVGEVQVRSVRVDFRPVSRNFYVRTCVKFTFANKIEAMHERSLVSVKVDPRSTSRLSSALFIWPAIRCPSLFVWETRGKGLFSSPPLIKKCLIAGYFLSRLYFISLRRADAFPVVASLPPKNSHFFPRGNVTDAHEPCELVLDF